MQLVLVRFLEAMDLNDTYPLCLSYLTLVSGLCDQEILDTGKKYTKEMISK